jgi:hypothetical protein
MMDDVQPEPNHREHFWQGGAHAGQPGWARRNRLGLSALVALLLLAAGFGELAPSDLGLTSAARPYNAFHLVAGVLGLAVLVFGGPRASATFNLIFGVIDLYQAVAGVLGLGPAQLFALRPADHVIHVVLGAALVALAAWGRPRRGPDTLGVVHTSVIHPSSSGQTPV